MYNGIIYKAISFNGKKYYGLTTFSLKKRKEHENFKFKTNSIGALRRWHNENCKNNGIEILNNQK